MIDGATRWQTFRRVVLPMVGAASRRRRCCASSSPGPSSCCRCSSPPIIRTVPVKITTFVTSTGIGMGLHLGARHRRHPARLHLHSARATPSGARPHSGITQGMRPRARQVKLNPREELPMSLRTTTRRPLSPIRRGTSPRGASPSASSCARWRWPASASRPSPPGCSARRGHYRGNWASSAARRMAQTPEEMTKWLKDVGRPFKGTKIRYTSEATPPTVVLNQIKDEFTEPTGIEVEIEIVPLEQVLAKATQDVQGQLGTYDLYYLDQSWMATFAQDTVDPVQYYKDKPDLAMPGFDFEDFSQAAGRRSRRLRRQVGRHSLRHPDLHHHVPQGHPREARHQAADDFRRIHRRGEGDHRSREGQWHLRHRPPGEVGSLLARMRLDRRRSGAMAARSSTKDKKFTGNDEQASTACSGIRRC